MRAHIRNRNDLVKLVEENPPRGAIGNVIVTGTCELLGAFKQMIPSIHAGWVLRITSANKQTIYLVAITHTKYMPDWKIYEIDNIPWDQWVGEDVTSGLAKGDLNTYEECVIEHRKALDHEQTIQRIHKDRGPMPYSFQADGADEDKSDDVQLDDEG